MNEPGQDNKAPPGATVSQLNPHTILSRFRLAQQVMMGASPEAILGTAIQFVEEFGHPASGELVAGIKALMTQPKRPPLIMPRK